MSLFHDLIAENPHYSLDYAWDWIIDEYARDFRSFWGLDGREPPRDVDWDDWTALGGASSAGHEIGGWSSESDPYAASQGQLACGT